VRGSAATRGDESSLTTARLLLRRWRPEDEAALAAINRDPEVTRYLNRPVDEAATTAFYGACLEHWERHGFGFFAVESRQEGTRGRFLGFVGVGYPAFLPELAARPEIGWRLAPEVWGRGLATEAALASRDDAWERLGLGELISIIHPANEASRRVATKLGMAIERRVQNPVLGRPVEVWQMAPGRPPARSSPAWG
jgi:RimJ/RimL family protein N-acetyltransferase